MQKLTITSAESVFSYLFVIHEETSGKEPVLVSRHKSWITLHFLQREKLSGEGSSLTLSDLHPPACMGVEAGFFVGSTTLTKDL